MGIQKSESIANLAVALIAAQGDFPAVKKESVNPFFGSRYAELGAIIEAAQPTLQKHGLAFTQLSGSDGDGQPTVTTMLIHKSGEYLAETLTMPAVKLDPQGVGSALTYGRRYGLQAILGIAAEDDDDANVASDAPAPQRTAPSASGSKTIPNQIAFKLAEWREEEGKFGPILILTPAAPLHKGGKIVPERLFKNKTTMPFFEHLKDCTGMNLVFSTEKKGEYTNLKELISVDGVPYIKPNGTPPIAHRDPTLITNEDIPF